MRVVFTGTAGCGKTSLIEKIAERGIVTVPEMARIVIAEEMKKDSECLPWRNLYMFQEKVARLQLEQEHSYDGKLLALDRGVVDGHGYSLNGEIATPNLILEKGIQRYPVVFMLDRLPFYKTDSERKESSKMAERIHHQIHRAYRETGHNPIRIPVIGSVEERADYVIKILERRL